jgi:hypothetical protein
MPKKKTGQRKKAEKQKMRQKGIRDAKGNRDVADYPCNISMVSVYYAISYVCTGMYAYKIYIYCMSQTYILLYFSMYNKYTVQYLHICV